MRRAFLCLVAAAGLIGATPARAQTAAVEGLWRTEDQRGVVAIAACEAGAMCGRLVWFEPGPDEVGKPPIDDHNPDPRLRGRPLCGMTLMGGFKQAGDSEWHDGWIYNPENGKTYSARMSLETAQRLRLRGYIGLPLFGESQIWTRAEAVAPCTPP